ncbi:MAG: hypothetical protein ACLGIO_04940 [Acidimicrobiia bacterium]
MAGAFDAANATIEAQRKALLSAMATAGTAGAEAVKAAQADLAARRQAAVAAAQAAAGGRDAPAALQAQLGSTIATPYDASAAALTAGAASRTGDLAARQANTESYLGEVSAAMPVVRAQAERQLAELRARAAREAAGDSLARERHQLDRERFEWEKSQRSQPGVDLSDAELANRLMGAASLRQQEAAAAPPVEIRGPRIMGSARIRKNVFDPDRDTPLETLARRAGVAAGIDPVRVHGVVPAPAAADPADAHRESVYNRARVHASPATFTEFETAADLNDPGLARQYVAKLSDADLRAAGISRKSLLAWVDDFYSRG